MCERLFMDAVSALFDGPRAQRAFALKAVFEGTWSLTVEDRAPLTVVVMARGRATFTRGRESTEVGVGDVVVVRGPAPYTVADSASTPADIRILPGQVCVDPHGRLLAEDLRLGVRTWGNSRSADATVMLIGTYEQETSVGSLVLSRLPEQLVLHDLDPRLVELFATELVGDEPGQSAVLDRLLDLLVVRCARAALADPSGTAADPLVGRVLRAMEEHPERPWTVASLATHVGLSRAALARRFTARMGEPPLTYLTRWRLALAADLLAGTDQTIGAIAARVGYGTPFALSAAFKRVHGESPRDYRRRQAA
ncbi:cupin domain-containing protein [Nocardioides pantholopis]|uniref:cupin domain-containing protein n=1 Tax=Nocardioides pantholopis TaxID=2483798 RepID=UPI001F495B1A|nr:AraC family transcriptional regulator [Nocardioides pantholopis]